MSWLLVALAVIGLLVLLAVPWLRRRPRSRSLRQTTSRRPLPPPPGDGSP